MHMMVTPTMRLQELDLSAIKAEGRKFGDLSSMDGQEFKGARGEGSWLLKGGRGS